MKALLRALAMAGALAASFQPTATADINTTNQQTPKTTKTMALAITDSTFDQLAAQGKPMMVDFWATWCGPCRKVGPYVEELAEQYAGQAIIGKVDVDENDELAIRFGVRNIPTILFIKDGQVVDKQIGAAPKAELEKKLQAIL